jgi:hypothetical protein
MEDRVIPSQFVCELFRDVAWMGVEDVHRVPGWDGPNKTLKKDHSIWMSRYASWAPLCARWGDPATLNHRLNTLQAFFEGEVARDLQRRDYLNAIKKSAAIAEIVLYHPGAGNIRTVAASGEGYARAVRLLGDEEYWMSSATGTYEESRKDREEAALAVRRVEGAWDAWADPLGNYREPGAERRVPGVPDGRDFWTYEWGLLATAPHLRYDTNARMRLWERKIQIEMEIVTTKMIFDQYFETCIEEARGIIGS